MRRWASTRVGVIAGVVSGTLIALLVSGVLAAAGLLSTEAPSSATAGTASRGTTPSSVQQCLSPRGVFCAAPALSKRNHHPTKRKPASGIAAPVAP